MKIKYEEHVQRTRDRTRIWASGGLRPLSGEKVQGEQDKERADDIVGSSPEASMP